MAFASLAVLQSAEAHCEMVAQDPYGCDVWDCYAIGCLYWHCDNTAGNGEFCYDHH
ncbi:hypothetical protein [Indibacter alkaliphilus]|uniref:hypothetical protein n=1 Tax=Indibacter alkaliphilus TaxID=579922 RepID=UPI001363B696|nr:hypothetical protein [Indibacter alkaliphilus]